MLGVRLTTELESMLESVARQQGRNKSDVARTAIQRYVETHDEVFRAEARRQSLAAAARGWSDEDREWEALGTMWDDAEPLTTANAAE
ncbi:CopG family transcriptional regulator [Sphingomonas sp.]|uniref:CopG family transcriptional regulator n=1 Tax=Sphingomonas sp. TaxID=28214 RepID=UPI0035BC0C61